MSASPSSKQITDAPPIAATLLRGRVGDPGLGVIS